VQSLTKLFNSRIDALPVTFARIVVGLLALLRALEGYRLGMRVLDPNTLKAPLIAGLTIPPEVLLIIVPAWAISAVLFTLGLWLRLSGYILALCMLLTLFMDEQLWSNHLYLLTLEVVLLTIAGTVPRPTAGGVQAWPVALLKIQLSIVYIFAAITKITPTFLSGAVLYLNLKRDGLFALPPTLRTLPVMAALSAATIVIEIFLAFALWSPKYRRVGVAVGIMFHVALTAMIVPVVAVQLAVFSLSVLVLYPLYFFPFREDCGLDSRHLLTDHG
jgi:hypothetical protein